MDKTLQRAQLLYGADAIEKLKQARVLVAGCGGVGSLAIEALARSGVGTLILIDRDTVEESNLNRQLCALHSTIAKAKTEVFQERIGDIHPDCTVILHTGWYDQSLDEWVLAQKPDVILDCIDSMRSKEELLSLAVTHAVPVISSMGMARRKDPSALRVIELEKTSGDPMARRLRVWKRKNRIRAKIMTVCSSELPMKMPVGQPLPSAMFVPAAAGLLMAQWCVDTIISAPFSQDRKE